MAGRNEAAAATLALGPVTFNTFELPARIVFGGAQALATHEVSGGGRVVDVLGAQPDDIAWHGVFNGGDAADRARLLDWMCAAGGTWTLAWDAFAYTVVIRHFAAAYERPGWVPYYLVCTVVDDPVLLVASLAFDAGAAAAADLAQAGDSFDVAAVRDLLLTPDATRPGGGAFVSAMAALEVLRATADGSVDEAGSALLGASDPVSAASAAGTLARAADARGYVRRAATTVGEAASA